ncbi:MAG: DUF1559 domain-containing protein [Planctomycetia bacterium]|nr:DUF1559 domain-containing protein [Planctomycetia bacterium]
MRNGSSLIALTCFLSLSLVLSQVTATALAADAPPAGLVGHAHTAGFSTILPPNSPSCADNNMWPSKVLASASSFHNGGAHVAMADGSARFIAESIDCGTLSTTTEPSATAANQKSPYGVWGALGTFNGGEFFSAGDF